MFSMPTCGRFRRGRDAFEAVNLREIEDAVEPQDGVAGFFAGLLVLLLDAFAENDGAGTFAFADHAAKLLGLVERQPER